MTRIRRLIGFKLRSQLLVLLAVPDLSERLLAHVPEYEFLVRSYAVNIKAQPEVRDPNSDSRAIEPQLLGIGR